MERSRHWKIRTRKSRRRGRTRKPRGARKNDENAVLEKQCLAWDGKHIFACIRACFPKKNRVPKSMFFPRMLAGVGQTPHGNAFSHRAANGDVTLFIHRYAVIYICIYTYAYTYMYTAALTDHHDALCRSGFQRQVLSPLLTWRLMGVSN